jgi:hypothetical protein
MKKRLQPQSAFFDPRVFISFLLIFGAILLAFGGAGLSPTPVAQAQNQISAPTQTLNVPFLTMGTAPDVLQCRGILSQGIIDLVNSATEDPAVTFERNRRAHPHMIMMPPTLDCASSLWRTVRTTGTAPSVDAAAINSRQYAVYSVFNSGPLAALVGTNINPAAGVEGYQGETAISIDPNNPLHMVAHSNTFFKDTTAQCQSPTGGTASTFGTMALFGSSDGGATWTYNCAPWHTAVTGGVTSANAWFGSDPALAWDNQGRAYAVYMLLSQNSSGSAGASIVVARSTDNGQTWSQFGSPVVNRIAVTTSLDDKEMFVIDNTSGQAHSFPGRLYVIWDEGNVERIAHSDDGVTWTTVLPPSSTAAIGGNLAIGPDGTVYASGRATTSRRLSFRNRQTVGPPGLHQRLLQRMLCNHSVPTTFRPRKTLEVSTALPQSMSIETQSRLSSEIFMSRTQTFRQARVLGRTSIPT